jgi:putative sulfotransferase
MSTPTFIVGTGRWGSTMLSNMLREHPKVLSVSEFFAMLVARAPALEHISPEPIDGRRFWEIVSANPPFHSFALRHGIESTEMLYPFDAPTARFSRKTGVPAIMLATLPHLTDDHDYLFDVLGGEANTWHKAPVPEHYRHLFDWLAKHFDKQIWVERSGGATLMMIEDMLAMFENARFVHIVRDGRDTALSMQSHPGFRLGVAMVMLQQFLGVDPFDSTDRTHVDRLPAELRAFLPEQFDADAFGTFDVPLASCGQFWARFIDNGLTGLRSVPTDRLLTLRYEDFFDDPKRQIDMLAAFLGEEFVDEDWSTCCATTVRKPRSTWRDLPEEDAHALTEACRPGFELLREAGVAYEI